MFYVRLIKVLLRLKTYNLNNDVSNISAKTLVLTCFLGLFFVHKVHI